MLGPYTPERPTVTFQTIGISGNGFCTPVLFSWSHSRGKHKAPGVMNMPFPRP